MSKLIYIDTETTGLYPNKHGLTQVAAIVVIDGEEVERINLDINPNTYRTFTPEIDDYALKVQNKTLEQISLQSPSLIQFNNFLSMIIGHLDEDEQYQIIGYNTSFDIGFIKAWFKDNGVSFSNFFSYKDVDVFALVKHMRLWGLLEECEDDKLGTVAKAYGIKLDAHDALNDIIATRELYKALTEELGQTREYQ